MKIDGSFGLSTQPSRGIGPRHGDGAHTWWRAGRWPTRFYWWALGGLWGDVGQGLVDQGLPACSGDGEAVTDGSVKEFVGVRWAPTSGGGLQADLQHGEESWVLRTGGIEGRWPVLSPDAGKVVEAVGDQRPATHEQGGGMHDRWLGPARNRGGGRDTDMWAPWPQCRVLNWFKPSQSIQACSNSF
jgi:hypothetical protein